MQKTRVRPLIQEDPTCCGEAKPTRYSYRACALQPGRQNYGVQRHNYRVVCLEPRPTAGGATATATSRAARPLQ